MPPTDKPLGIWEPKHKTPEPLVVQILHLIPIEPAENGRLPWFQLGMPRESSERTIPLVQRRIRMFHEPLHDLSGFAPTFPNRPDRSVWVDAPEHRPIRLSLQALRTALTPCSSFLVKLAFWSMRSWESEPCLFSWLAGGFPRSHGPWGSYQDGVNKRLGPIALSTGAKG